MTWSAILAIAMAIAIEASRQQPAPQQPPPAFRSTTTVVEVDVIARDRRGRFVADLGPGDFEVLEDGEPREVSVLYRVMGPKDAPAPDAAAPPTPALPAPSGQAAQRVLVFFFDHDHMTPGALARAKNAALQFLQRDFREGDVGGVLNGAVMVNNRLTGERQALEAAVSALTPAADSGAVMRELRQWPRFTDIVEAWRVTRNEPGYNPGPTLVGDVAARACRERPGECQGTGGSALVESQVRDKAGQIVGQARVLGQQTLRTIAALANGLARLPGRKTVILFGEGFFVEDSWADLKNVVGRAARAYVRIYAVDTRGLNRGSASSDIIGAEAPAQPEMAPPSAGDTSADGPNSLAVDTGGYVVRNENDFGKALSEIDKDTSSYYIVGFRMTKPPDGTYHALSVRVKKRAGVTVRARKGYVAEASPSPSPGPGLSPSPGPSLSSSPSPSPSLNPPAPSPAATAPPAPSPAGRADAPPAPPAAAAPAAPALAIRARPPVEERVTSLEAKSAGHAGLPDDVLKSARAGWEAYQRGDVKAAREALRPAAANPAAPPWTRYVLGWSEYASSDFPAATAAWEQVRQAVPEFEAVYFDLADGYLQQKEFGKTLAALRQAQKRWPKDVEVYNAIGVVQAGRGALNEAIKTFEEAVALAPNDATACYNLAKSLELRYVQMQRLRKVSAQNLPAATLDRDRAVEYYRRTVQLGGPNAEAAKEGLRRLAGSL